MARIIRKLNPALRAALHMAPGLHYDAKRKDLRAPETLANFRAEPGHRAAH
jgi:hypothetical protein